MAILPSRTISTCMAWSMTSNAETRRGPHSESNYSGDIPEENAPKWMSDSYEVCMRDTNLVVANLLQDTDFHGEFNYIAIASITLKGNDTIVTFSLGNWLKAFGEYIE